MLRLIVCATKSLSFFFFWFESLRILLDISSPSLNLAWGRSVDRDAPSMTEKSVTYSQHSEQLQCSILTTALCNKKLV